MTGNLAGQESVPPWITAAPGLAHPAAWDMTSRPLTLAVQQQPRWNGMDPTLHGSWLGAGWRPGPTGMGGRRAGGSWGFGLVVQDDPQVTGWRGQTIEAAAATSTRINRDWRATAGWALGLSRWMLDPTSWSWDAQYGPSGYDPTLSSGEQGLAAAGGTRAEAALSLGLAPADPRPGTADRGPRGALTLRHTLGGRMPHLATDAADTVAWRWSWWAEHGGTFARQRLEWKGWHRGSLQGPGHLLEIGFTLGRNFGTSSRFTRHSMSHQLATGLLLRSDGLLRLAVAWERDGITLTTGPGWTWGTLWRPPPGWTVSLTWAPDPDGSVSLVR